MRRLLAAVLVWVGFALLASADPFPMLYDVTGVAPNDELNIRAEPQASSLRLGALAYNARNIEIVRTDTKGRWGLLNWGETTGWVSMRYLRDRPDPLGFLPAKTVRCFGTEPFWSLTIHQGEKSSFQLLGNPKLHGRVGTLNPSNGRRDRLVVQGVDSIGQFSAVLRAQHCSDGMSDREYSIDADVLFHDDRMEYFAGCCSIAPN